MTTATTLPPQPFKGRLLYKPDITVVGLFGKQGSGKSAIMAYLLAAEHNDGREVYYWPPAYQFVYGTPLQTTALVRLTDDATHNYINGAVLGVDEIQVLLSRFRMGATVNQVIMAFFQQLRKRGVDLIYTSNAPQRLDRGLEDQTTFHGPCTFNADENCKEGGFHRSGCLCTAIWRMKDTQQAFGFRPGAGRDPRKVVPYVIPGITEAFRWYNTHGTADPADVLGMDKRAILKRASEDKAGMTLDELCLMLREEWVPSAVQAGAKHLTPEGFAATVNKQLGLSLDPRTVGHALRRVGLPPTRNSKGMVYALPPADAIAEWQQGTWSPDD